MSQDILLFKEEILKTVRSYKESLIKEMVLKLSHLNEKNEKLEKDLNNLKENNKQLIDNLTIKIVDLDKLKQLDMFKNKVDSMLLTHDIRINNNIEEISSIKAKYDKALIDNLLVPGFVGPSCQFKKLSDYIVNNISEVSKLKFEKEITKSSLKEMKAKNDSFIKTVFNLTESYSKRNNDYTNTQVNEVKILISQKNQERDLKEIEIQKSIENIEKELNNMKLNEKLEELKNDILSIIDSKLEDLKKNQEEFFTKEFNKNNSKYEIYVKDTIKETVDDKLKEIKNSISELKNKIKNEKFPIIPKIKKDLMKNENLVNYIERLRKGKTNDFMNMNKKNIFGPNKTYSNIKEMLNKNNINRSVDNQNQNEMQKNNHTKSLESLLIEEIEMENKKREDENNIPDIILKNKDSKLSLIDSNNKEKLKKYNIVNEIKSEKSYRNNYNNFNINGARKVDLFAEVSDNSAFIQKNIYKLNDKNETDNNNDKNKYLKNEKNMTISQNNKVSFILPNNLKTDEDIKNRQKISKENKSVCEKVKLNIKDKLLKENKLTSNIIDELKIPQILEKRILSKNELEEMKLNSEKNRNLNKKINFKKQLNKSVSASYKTNNKNSIYFTPNPKKELKNLRKTVINKGDNSMRFIKERNRYNNVYNKGNFDFGQDNYSMYGVTIQANKRYLNNHFNKNEVINSFNKLYNA